VTRHLDGYEVPTIDFTFLTEQQTAELAREFVRVSRRWVVAFSSDRGLGPWIASFGPSFVRTMVWVKTDPMPQMTGDRPAHGFEVMALAHDKGRKRWNGGGAPGNYVGHRGDGKRGHPTQKPDWLMERLVRDFTNEGETILDPFAGSGATGVAAIRLGRRFIGCERDPKYHAIATKRLSQAREQLGLWTGAA
jgi:site-specific DNA-methyltransferase (adenine-specific)